MAAEIQQFLEQSEQTRRQLQEILWSAKRLAEAASEEELKKMFAATEANAQLSGDLNQLMLDLLTTRRLQSGPAHDGLRDALENPPLRTNSGRRTG